MTSHKSIESVLSSTERFEAEFLASLSIEGPWSIVEQFSQLERLSGSDDEAKAFGILVEHLERWGVPHTMHEVECLISLPRQASLRLTTGNDRGRVFAAKTSAMSISTAGGEIGGELLYVPGSLGSSAGDVISASVELGGVDAQGRIVITEGMPFPGKVAAVTAAGARAGIFVSPGQRIHESICSPIWGTPDLETWHELPSIPVIAVNNDAGAVLIEKAKCGDHVALSTVLETGWRSIPILIAEIPGSDYRDEFILLHGHVDSWHVGVGDNATGNAAMLEIARTAWRIREQLRRTLRIAWWSGHSHGRYAGSAWYADEFAIDIMQNCIVQMNCDSPGCRWATTFDGLMSMSECGPLVRSVVHDVTGVEPTLTRPPRAGDYSFNGLGVSGCFMLSSTMSEADRAARGYYAVGGCGGNIAWHTEDDTLEIADRDNLLRDIRVYGAAVLRMANSRIHPMDWRLTLDEFEQTIARYQDAAGDLFGFAPARSAIRDLRRMLDRFYEVATSPDLEEHKITTINATQRRLGRLLIPVNYSRVPPFQHDPALNVPPLPDLAPALTTGTRSDDPAFLRVLQTHLRRGQNRLVWALAMATETVAAALAD